MRLKNQGFYNVGYESDNDIARVSDDQSNLSPEDKKEEEESPPKPIPSPASRLYSSDSNSNKNGIFKNVIIISFAFMLNFTSFNSMANLQSSLNEKLGTSSLSTIYAALVLSCAFVPSWLIKKLKAKWTLVVCMLCYSSYIAAQFYPTYYTLIPTAILLGLGAAPMWSAKCTYLTQVGGTYGQIVGEDKEVIVTRFFGIFFLFFQSSQVWGNLISSTVLSTNVLATVKTEEELSDTCGAKFCPESNQIGITSTYMNFSSNTTITNEAEYSKIVTMSSIYLGCSLLSVIIIALFVDPLSKFSEETTASAKSGKELLVATFTHMLKINQILIIPLTMWSGVEQAFLQADFTAAFVKCSLGVHMVGYVMICYGVCDSICSLCFSPLVKRIGRIPIFSFGAFVNVIMLILMRLWIPHPDDNSIFFIIAALWGIADAIWQAQINAFYGVIFPGESEAAFSNYRLWESIGFIFAFVWSTLICVQIKIYILLGMLAIGMAGYYVIEILERNGGLKYKSKTIVTLKDFR